MAYTGSDLNTALVQWIRSGGSGSGGEATSVDAGTATPAVTQQRPNNNSTQILIQSTVPPEGRTNEAPFMWHQGGATFLSEWDPVMYLGYNADRAVATEPSMRWVIEGNYKTGASTRTVESYWEYYDTTGNSYRPIFLTTYKDDLAHTTLEFLGDSINFKKADGTVRAQVGSNGIQAGSSYINPSGQLNVSASGAATLANTDASAFNLIASLYAPNLTDGQEAYLNIGQSSGNSDHIFITYKRIGSGSSSNYGALGFAGSTAAITFIKSGVMGIYQTSPTAKLHLGAGTATASTAPLKFTSGTNLTTAEAGAMEYNGTNLFFTRTGTTRENVLVSSAVNSVSPTSPNRTLTVNIGGTDYYIAAKTTND